MTTTLETPRRTTLELVEFRPVTLHLAAGRAGIDGPDIHCAFETAWCRNHSNLAGGFDDHHEWPKSLGGSEAATDVQHLLHLCPTHHRRQHALIRAMVEAGTTRIRTVRYFTPAEIATASYAVAQWVAVGRPRIGGWPCPAAALKVA